MISHREIDSNGQSRALKELSKTLIQAQEWERAEVIINKIERNAQVEKVEVLSELEVALVPAQSLEQAWSVWIEVEVIASTIEQEVERAKVLSNLALILMQVQQWDRAEKVIRSIE